MTERPKDNRAARRRAANHQMRDLLERFAAQSPEHVVLGDNLGGPDVVCCFYCGRDWGLFSDRDWGLFSDPSDHAPDCVYREVVTWLAAHPQSDSSLPAPTRGR